MNTTEPDTKPPAATLEEQIAELLGALKESSRVAAELRGEMRGLVTKLNMVALAQLAGEAKGISHDLAIKELRTDVQALQQLLTAAE